MTALRTLIEAVEAGTLRDVDWSWGAFPDGLSWDQVATAYDGSVDAALALMEAVLPGWRWLVRSPSPSDPAVNGCKRGSFLGNVWREDDEPNRGDDHFPAWADTPARALLLAILKAMEATTAGKE